MYGIELDSTNKIGAIEFTEGISLIDNILDGYKNYQILSVALEIGIFEEIADIGPCSPRDIAKAALVNGMFIRSILMALEDMDFLKSDDDMYILTEPAETFLLKSSPLYQGDLILSTGSYKSQWNNLMAVLLHQKGPVKSKELDESRIRSIAQQSIRGEIQKVIKEIVSHPEFPEFEYLLDIGGSPGLYSIALCQENNKLLATILEQEAVPLTTSLVREYGMENQIKVEKGDIKNLKYPGEGEGYDIVVISHLLYRYRREMGDVLENVAHILNPGGILVLNHRFCSPNCDIKPGDGVREIDRALNSFGHPLCHPEGLKEGLENLGFVNVSLIPHETALGYAVLFIGTKEGELSKKASEAPVEITSDNHGDEGDKCC